MALKNQLQNLFLQVYLQVWDKARADRENLIEAVHYAFLIMIELHNNYIFPYAPPRNIPSYGGAWEGRLCITKNHRLSYERRCKGSIV